MRLSTTISCYVVLTTCLFAQRASSVPYYRHRRDVTSDYNDDDKDLRTYRRNDKSLAFYDYIQPPYYVPDLRFNGFGGPEDANEILARTDPMDQIMRAKPPAIPYADSPIYYIRLPPTPYVFVPGLGYVSQPPPPTPPQLNPFINLPLDFIANGKPTNIYQWSGAPAMSPPGFDYPKPKPSKPESSINNLNKGPYVFNGRPSDVYVLRDSVNALYSDALQNFYP